MIQLDENYRIEQDENNWMLVYEEKKYNVEKQKHYTSTDKWYFPKLKWCLEKYVDQCLKPSISVYDLLTKLSEISGLINKLEK